MTARGPGHETVYLLEPAADAEALLGGLAALLPGRLADAPPERLTVLDTADGRLAEHDALLLCSGGGGRASLRLLRPGQPDERAGAPRAPDFRRELPAGALRDALGPLVEGRRLLPQLQVEWRRAEHEVHDAGSKIVARVRLEAGRARPAAGGGWAPLPARLAVAPVRGYRAEHAAVVAAVASRPGLRLAAPHAPPPLLAALRAALPPRPPVPGADLGPSLRADEALRRLHRAHLAVLRWNEPGVRADLDSEFLHDLRVAVRRTRSLLGQFKQVFPEAEVTHFRAELGWLGRLTGPTRDLDVFCEDVEEQMEADPALAALAPLLACLRARQRREHAALVEGLDSPRARALLAGWEAFLARAPEAGPGPAHAKRPLAGLAARRVEKLYRRIVDSGKALGPDAPADALHGLRIEYKKMRYVLDGTRRLFAAQPAAEVLAALKHLQSALGQANDAHVQGGLLQVALADLAATGTAEPATLLAAGRLAERIAARGAAARADFAPRFAAFAAEATRSRVRRLARRPRKRTR